MRISGKVQGDFGGQKNVYITAGQYGSKLSGAGGEFIVEVPFGQEYVLKLSRTNIVLRPPALAGTALRDQQIAIEAVSTNPDTDGCWIRDMAPGKLALAMAAADFQSYGAPTTGLARTLLTLMQQIDNLPEVYLNCPESLVCVRADLRRNVASIRKGSARIIRATSGVIRQAKKNKLQNAGIITQKMQSIKSVMKQKTARLPASTYVCR